MDRQKGRHTGRVITHRQVEDREVQIDCAADRQTDRHRQGDRQRDRRIERQTDRQTDR